MVPWATKNSGQKWLHKYKTWAKSQQAERKYERKKGNNKKKKGKESGKKAQLFMFHCFWQECKKLFLSFKATALEDRWKVVC